MHSDTGRAYSSNSPEYPNRRQLSPLYDFSKSIQIKKFQMKSKVLSLAAFIFFCCWQLTLMKTTFLVFPILYLPSPILSTKNFFSQVHLLAIEQTCPCRSLLCVFVVGRLGLPAMESSSCGTSTCSKGSEGRLGVKLGIDEGFSLKFKSFGFSVIFPLTSGSVLCCWPGVW